MDFMIFIAAMLIMVVILSLIFGNVVVGGVMNLLAPGQPSYLAEEYATFLTVVSYAPGDMQVGIKSNVERPIEIVGVAPGFAVRVVSGTEYETRYFLHNNLFIATPEQSNLISGSVTYAKKINDIITLEVVAQ